MTHKRARRGELVRLDDEVDSTTSEFVANVEDEAEETTRDNLRDMVRVNVQEVLKDLDLRVDTPSKAKEILLEEMSTI